MTKKYIKNEKYLYTCFVDFQNAYDSILGEELRYKLQNIGNQEKILQVIQDDILSSQFLNLYINDLPAYLTLTNSEVVNQYTYLGSLLFYQEKNMWIVRFHPSTFSYYRFSLEIEFKMQLGVFGGGGRL